MFPRAQISGIEKTKKSDIITVLITLLLGHTFIIRNELTSVDFLNTCDPSTLTAPTVSFSSCLGLYKSATFIEVKNLFGFLGKMDFINIIYT